MTADLAIISDVRQIEARDPFVAKERTTWRGIRQGRLAEKAQRVRARIAGREQGQGCQARLGRTHAQARTRCQAIAAALTPSRRRRARSCANTEQGCNAAKAGRAVRRPDSRVLAPARRAAAGRFPARVDAGQSGRFQLAEILRLVQSA